MTPFWTMTAIRVGYWLAAIVALLWAPVRSSIPHFPADGPHLSLVFNVFAQWDSGWFIRIADHGYDVKQSASFFPLYPLLVRGVAEVLRSTVIAGVLVSVIAAGIAAIAIFKIAQRLVSEAVASDSVLFLALFPFAFVFTAVYSDALFLALASWSLLAAQRQQAILASLLGGLAVATRPMGLALLPALLVLLWPKERSVRSILRPLALVLLPAALGAYALYLHSHFDDAGAFYHSPNVFWLRETPPLGPLQERGTRFAPLRTVRPSSFFTCPPRTDTQQVSRTPSSEAHGISCKGCFSFRPQALPGWYGSASELRSASTQRP
jgi:Gpi18-like mannosyltransferase